MRREGMLNVLQAMQLKGQAVKGAPDHPLQCIGRALSQQQYARAAPLLEYLLHPEESSRCRQPLSAFELDFLK